MPFRTILTALLGIAATPALACQCDDPATMPATEQEERARWIAGRHLIIAEVVRLPNGADPNVERYQLVRRIIGHAPEEIIVHHRVTRLPDGRVLAGPFSSCDFSAPPGIKLIMAFAKEPSFGACGAPILDRGAVIRPAPMCTQFSVQHPPTLERVINLTKTGERG